MKPARQFVKVEIRDKAMSHIIKKSNVSQWDKVRDQVQDKVLLQTWTQVLKQVRDKVQ